MADYSGLASGILGAAGTVAGAITGQRRDTARAAAAQRRKAEYDRALQALTEDYQRQVQMLRQQYRDVTPPPGVEMERSRIDGEGVMPMGLSRTEGVGYAPSAESGLAGAVPTMGPTGFETEY